MGRKWQDVKAEKERRDRAAGRDVDAARAAAGTITSAYILGHRLAQLRQELGLTQGQIAGRMGITQPRVSKLEQGEVDQMEVDTLRRYIAALGGQLKLIADFEDHDVNVSVSELDRGQAHA